MRNNRLWPESATVHKRSSAQTAQPAQDNVLFGKNDGGNVKKSVTKTLLAVIGLTALSAVAAWQFYLFAVFKDADGILDVQGGKLHLGLAVGIALSVCIAAIFLFSKLLRHDPQDEIHITSPGPIVRGGTKEEAL
jgi:hypothetical protein